MDIHRTFNFVAFGIGNELFLYDMYNNKITCKFGKFNNQIINIKFLFEDKIKLLCNDKDFV